MEAMFGSSLPPVVCRELLSYLRYLCLFVCDGVQHVLCCVFLHFVFPMLPVSLDCPFVIAPSVFSDVYLHYPVKGYHQFSGI